MMLAVQQGHFALFCAGATVYGFHNAFSLQIRFAAIDTVPEKHKGRAVGFILFGGVLASFLGPAIAGFGQTLQSVEYAGSFFLIMLFCIGNIILLQFIFIPRASGAAIKKAGRPVRYFFSSFGFLTALLSAVIAYAAMNLLMTATPLAIIGEGYSDGVVRTAIGAHVLLMYAPSFITGFLIEKIGSRRMVSLGMGLVFICLLINLQGREALHFHLSMVLLGIGWNFMFMAGTTLLSAQYRPEEAPKMQAVNDFCIFTTVMITSFVSGALVKIFGWDGLNIITALLFLPVMGVMVAENFRIRYKRVRATVS